MNFFVDNAIKVVNSVMDRYQTIVLIASIRIRFMNYQNQVIINIPLNIKLKFNLFINKI